MDFWSQAGGVERWRQLLGAPEAQFQARALRQAAYPGQPFGDQAFIDQLRAQREALLARADGAASEPGGQRVASATHWAWATQ